MKSFLKYYRTKKGITLVFIALMLAVLLFFLGMAVDISYMYHVKNQLQVAADAAALAGAALLSDSDDLVQANARAEAIIFAAKNSAAGIPVEVITDNNNTLSNNNDITVGNWDATRDPKYLAGQTPVNAIEVRPQRVQGLSGTRGDVRVFVGQVFRLMGINWGYMSAAASAIASLQSPFIAPLPICLPVCENMFQTPLDGQWNYNKNEDEPILCTDTAGSPPGQLFLLESSSQSEPKKPGLAWTNFDINECGSSPSCQNPPNKGDILPYIQGKNAPNICNKHICTTNGTISNLLDDLETIFNNNKKPYEFNAGGTTLNITGWKVLIPVVSNLSCGVAQQSCPGAQGGAANPYFVERYTEVLITDISKTGSPGQGMRLIALNSNVTHLSTTVTCKKGPITINRWVTAFGPSNCVDCNDPSISGGSTPKLVK